MFQTMSMASSEKFHSLSAEAALLAICVVCGQGGKIQKSWDSLPFLTRDLLPTAILGPAAVVYSSAQLASRLGSI